MTNVMTTKQKAELILAFLSNNKLVTTAGSPLADIAGAVLVDSHLLREDRITLDNEGSEIYLKTDPWHEFIITADGKVAYKDDAEAGTAWIDSSAAQMLKILVS